MSGQCWLTVPTHTSPPALDTIVAEAGIPAVVVLTDPAARPIPGAVNVSDVGPPNVHRWWNTGMDEIRARGGTIAVVANHDISPDPGALAAFAQGLVASGATLARVAREDTPPDLTWSGRRELTGWCFAVNLTHGLRAPEQYRWWYGDDWMDATARTLHGVAGVNARIRHHRPSGQLYPPAFGPLVSGDMRLWASEGRQFTTTSHRLGATS